MLFPHYKTVEGADFKHHTFSFLKHVTLKNDLALIVVAMILTAWRTSARVLYTVLGHSDCSWEAQTKPPVLTAFLQPILTFLQAAHTSFQVTSSVCQTQHRDVMSGNRKGYSMPHWCFCTKTTRWVFSQAGQFSQPGRTVDIFDVFSWYRQPRATACADNVENSPAVQTVNLLLFRFLAG